MRGDASSLQHFISLGEENEGWSSFEQLMEGASAEFTAVDTSSDEGALILYTSGTTKNPEGVLHTHCLYPRQEDAGAVLARLTGGRSALVHLRDELGQEHLERLPRAVELRDGDLLPRGKLRIRRAPGSHSILRDHGPLPGPHRVQAPRQDPRARKSGSLEDPARGLRGRAAQPAGHREVEGAAQHRDLRRLRPDGKHAARRELPEHGGATWLDGQTLSRLRRPRHRRRRQRVSARRAGRHRACSPHPRALQRVLEPAR
jgi:hypothetical protein